MDVRTPAGAMRARARFSEKLDPRVVVGEHGWWQAAPEAPDRRETKGDEEHASRARERAMNQQRHTEEERERRLERLELACE